MPASFALVPDRLAATALITEALPIAAVAFPTHGTAAAVLLP